MIWLRMKSPTGEISYMGKSINQSIHPSINARMERTNERSINQSFNQSIHPSVQGWNDQSINQSIDPTSTRFNFLFYWIKRTACAVNLPDHERWICSGRFADNAGTEEGIRGVVGRSGSGTITPSTRDSHCKATINTTTAHPKAVPIVHGWQKGLEQE